MARSRLKPEPIATRDVTGYRAFMPGPLPKNGVRALSVAERAAAYRARWSRWGLICRSLYLI
jgi:hypothetical protein